MGFSVWLDWRDNSIVTPIERQQCETENGVYPNEYTKTINIVTKKNVLA